MLPGPIATEIWDQPGNEPALFDVAKVPAADCAAGIADAIEGDGFEYYVPAEFPGGIGRQEEIVVGKTRDVDAFVSGMADEAPPRADPSPLHSDGCEPRPGCRSARRCPTAGRTASRAASRLRVHAGVRRAATASAHAVDGRGPSRAGCSRRRA